MVIESEKVVSLTYELRTQEGGEIVEKVEGENPLNFVFGAGMMLQKFEEKINGLKIGDTFKFSLSPAEAYGEFSEDALVELPKSIFEVEGVIDEQLLVVGNIVPMQDNQGNRFNGVVKELREDFVTMDFNHPMAGQSLFFEGAIVGVREPSEQELMSLKGGGGCGSGCGCGDNSGGGCGDSGCGDGGCGCETEGYGTYDEAESAGSCGSGCGCH